MSALSPTPTVAAVVTVTVTAAPVPQLFVLSFFGCLACMDMLLALAGIWTALIVGFNRFSVIPIIVPICAALGNGFFSVEQKLIQIDGHPVFSLGRYVVEMVFWTGEHLISNFYSYFILKALFSSEFKKWRVYVSGFWILFVFYICSAIMFYVSFGLDWELTGSHATKRVKSGALPATYICIASLEVWSAIFLLHALQKGRKRAKRAYGAQRRPKYIGLLQQLAQSTEIRLAAFASVGIIRCFTGFHDWSGGGSHAADVAIQVDSFAVLMENLFPVILIMDLLAARRRKSMETTNNYDPEQGPDVSRLPEENKGKPRGELRTVAVQTANPIRKEFAQYFRGRTDSSRGRSVTSEIPVTGSHSSEFQGEPGSSSEKDAEVIEENRSSKGDHTDGLAD